MEGRIGSSNGPMGAPTQSALPWLDGPQDGQLRHLVRRSRLIAACVLVALMALRIADVAPIQIPRLWSFDLLLQHRAPSAEPSPVVAVDIDDPSLARLGQWPWPRRHLVDLVIRLREGGAAMIVFNILFTEPDRMSPKNLGRELPGLDPDLRARLLAAGGYDEALAAAMWGIPVVTAVAAAPVAVSVPDDPGRQGRLAVRGTPDIEGLPAIGAIIDSVPPIRSASAGRGIVNLLPEPDDIARRVPTVFRVDGILEPALALETARVALGRQNVLVEVPTPLGVAGLSVGPLFVPTDGEGRLWVDTAESGRVPTISAAEVLAGRATREELAGRIAVVGTSASGVGEQMRIGDGRRVSGLQLQSLAIDTLMTGRAPVRDRVFVWAELAVTAIAGLLLIVVLPGVALIWKPVAGLGLAGLFAAAALSFQGVSGALVDATFPAGTVLLLAVVFLLGDFRAESLLRRRNEAALKRHDAYIREVVDASFDAIVTIGAEGRIRTANRAAAALLGAPGGTLVGRSIHERLAGAWARTLDEDPAAALRAAAASPDTIEAEVPAERGGVPTEITLAESVAGDERVYVLVLRDLSARRAAEDWAARTTQRLNDAVDAISDGFALFAPDGQLVRCNAAYLELIGAGADEVTPGTAYSDLLAAFAAGPHAPSEAEGRQEEWAQTRLSVFAAESQRYEMATVDARWYRVEEHRTAEGGMVCIYSNISEIRDREVELEAAKEQAEAASFAKSQFLANMSHELRTPLNAIIGFSDMMREQPFGPLGNDRYLTYASDISSSGSRLLRMIEQILEFARLEKLESNIEEAGIDVVATVMSAVTDLSPVAAERRVRILADLDPALPALRADPQMFYQITQNLLANAVKFSPAGATVTVAARTDGERRIVLSVADNGVGIPQEMLHNITQPFWQRPNAMTSSREGVGLGLAIVSAHVDAHGAELAVDSRPDEGTTVTVTFPAFRSV